MGQFTRYDDRRPQIRIDRAATKAALVVNVHSRSGDRAYSYAVDKLRELGVPLGQCFPLHDPARLVETVEAAIVEGHDLIVLGGGDGSVSSVVDVLAHRNVPLALLPLGTANDFARTMHIPSDLDVACRAIADGHIVDVDLGLCGDSYYVNRASIGLGASVAQHMSHTIKRYFGSLAYPVATAKAFVRRTPFAARLAFPSDEIAAREYDSVLQISVANGRYFGGGQLAAADSGIDDDALDVTVIRDAGVAGLLGVARGLKTGKTSTQVEHIRVRAVRLATDRPMPINIDGEVVAHTPNEFQVARNALHVVAPRQWVDGQRPSRG